MQSFPLRIHTILLFAFTVSAVSARAADGDGETVSPSIRIEKTHPWRPLFGLDRVGRTLEIVAELPENGGASAEYWISAHRNGIESERLEVPDGPGPHRMAIQPADGAALIVSGDGGHRELQRIQISLPPFEAAAAARPESLVNPVDLGLILPPADWLSIEAGKPALVEAAAVSYHRDYPDARVLAWFECDPDRRVSSPMPLKQWEKARIALPALSAPANAGRTALRVMIVSGDGDPLWSQFIETSIVRQPPEWPAFGAAETLLRYDAPISVRAADGTLSTMAYEDGWDAALRDVVVSLPNGSRFVFWRGSSYIPFWAGLHNTGLCYEWAETRPPEGFVDCVEPLMDKELRYGRVEIEESSASRVHVRWTYQSCDFHYKVWGDSAQEDYYFYPDGFGARVLTLNAAPGAEYELSEFILLTPAAAYPFGVFPRNMVDLLFPGGEMRSIGFPFFHEEQGGALAPKDAPPVYRVRLHRDEPLSAVYYSAVNTNPPVPFGPFTDAGQIVTPAYWGNHWPLGRGRTTGNAIDERVHLTPAHNSFMTWGFNRDPRPLRSAEFVSLGATGRPRQMEQRRWVWMIGMTDESGEALLARAKSFAHPPAVELRGARLNAEAYAPERRAIGLTAEEGEVRIAIRPEFPCVNPVFEIGGAPGPLAEIALDGRPLEGNEYAWDGRTLWIGIAIRESAVLRLRFADGRGGG